MIQVELIYGEDLEIEEVEESGCQDWKSERVLRMKNILPMVSLSCMFLSEYPIVVLIFSSWFFASQHLLHDSKGGCISQGIQTHTHTHLVGQVSSQHLKLCDSETKTRSRMGFQVGWVSTVVFSFFELEFHVWLWGQEPCQELFNPFTRWEPFTHHRPKKISVAETEKIMLPLLHCWYRYCWKLFQTAAKTQRVYSCGGLEQNRFLSQLWRGILGICTQGIRMFTPQPQAEKVWELDDHLAKDPQNRSYTFDLLEDAEQRRPFWRQWKNTGVFEEKLEKPCVSLLEGTLHFSLLFQFAGKSGWGCQKDWIGQWDLSVNKVCLWLCWFLSFSGTEAVPMYGMKQLYLL